MEPKRSKYDTNPLDEDVAHRADESFGRNGSGQRPKTQRAYKSVNQRPETARAPNEEAPTRRMNESDFYPSVFVPPPPRTSTTYEARHSSDIYHRHTIEYLSTRQYLSLSDRA
jgi:hypothetical protein